MKSSHRGSVGVVMVVGMLLACLAHPAGGAEVDPTVLAEIESAGSATYMVYLADRPDLEEINQSIDREHRSQAVLEQLKTVANRSQAGVISLLEELAGGGEVAGFRSHFISNVVVVTSGGLALQAIARRPEVAKIDSVRRYPVLSPDQKAAIEERAIEWNVERVGAPAAWAAGATGAGVVVATLDTGARYTHNTIVGQYRGTLSGGAYSHDFNWFDATGLCPLDEPCDDNGYGTGMVSLLVGDDGGANQVGMAPGARWITARGCEAFGCSTPSLLAGAEWLLAPCPVGIEPGHPDCDPGYRPDIIAVGWSGGGGDPWFQDAVDAWQAAGIVAVTMAGNGAPSPGTIGTPGCYCNVIAAGAVDDNDIVWPNSGRGPGPFECEAKPDLVAPGVSLRAAGSDADDAYTTVSGTGSSAAEVAGCAALLLSEAPWLTFGELRLLLSERADDIGDPGFDYDTGWGVVRCDLALAALGEMVFADDFERGSAWRWSARIQEPPPLYLFDGGGVPGAIGGRIGADGMCAAAVGGHPGLPTSNVRALLTVDADDEIRDMPQLYGVPTERPVMSVVGLLVAHDWADLLDGSIEQSLFSLGVLTDAVFWYTGSTAFGTVAPTTCSGWTDGSTQFDGRYGHRLNTDHGWISRHEATCGVSHYRVLCLAWE